MIDVVVHGVSCSVSVDDGASMRVAVTNSLLVLSAVVFVSFEANADREFLDAFELWIPLSVLVDGLA